MNSKNMHYAFYVEYPESFFNKAFDMSGNDELNLSKELNKELKDFKFKENMLSLDEGQLKGKISSFRLETLYPGLLVGTGNVHEMGQKGEVAMGFNFDYVTGLPYIPGSSVKGTLRSAFCYPEYIQECLGNGKDVDVEGLEIEIFGPKNGTERELSPKNTDVFFDAIVVNHLDHGIMGTDTITPHNIPAVDEVNERRLEGLTDPNPISFIKVKPEVTFEFRFLLSDSTQVNVKQKIELFKTIILDLGIGAKTNVGYGVMRDA